VRQADLRKDLPARPVPARAWAAGKERERPKQKQKTKKKKKTSGACAARCAFPVLNTSAGFVTPGRHIAIRH
jgi:hypothetical protein